MPDIREAIDRLIRLKQDCLEDGYHFSETQKTLTLAIETLIRLESGRLVEPCKQDERVISLLNILLTKLEKENEIISKETGKDYAHLSFKDGRAHTLMRVRAWANIQLKQERKNIAAAEAKEARK